MTARELTFPGEVNNWEPLCTFHDSQPLLSARDRLVILHHSLQTDDLQSAEKLFTFLNQNHIICNRRHFLKPASSK